MRYIQKGQEPENFTRWKNERKNQNKTWKNFNPPIKQEVRSSLLKEQGYICCYCEIRVTQNTCSIDHLIPQSIDKAMKFDYANLLVSCKGQDENGTSLKPVHCEQIKGDSLLPIAPLEVDCADHFAYTDDGQILPRQNSRKQEAAVKTIELLGLNTSALQRMRSRAIARNLFDVDALTQEEIQKMIQVYEELDQHGKYEEFCDAIIYKLRQYLV